ncbi:MAG: thermonuclease family protein, partial [Acidimicrobiia bacterium]|nr:thermonuclease family protein [Acidimicrobiia bacterium]
ICSVLILASIAAGCSASNSETLATSSTSSASVDGSTSTSFGKTEGDPGASTTLPSIATTAPPSAPTTSPAQGATLPAGDDATITRHVDGDTIYVSGLGSMRLIGIDTPETKDPRTVVECFGKEASNHLAALLPIGTRVRVTYDVERTDRYNRVLGYLYRSSDALFINAAMIIEGFAAAYRYPPNVANADWFSALDRQAREANVGLWAACGGINTPASGAGSGSTTTTAGGTSSGTDCSPSYPGVCIPPAPPDLDCGDVTYKRFVVLPPDPHNFDGNADGIGCV